MAVVTKSLEEIIKAAVLKEMGETKSLSSSVSCTSCASSNASNEESFIVPIGVSARHLHVTQEHLEILFGKGHQLTFKKELMGGQFAADERVTIVGTNLRVMENVRILGPCRKATQVEVSKSDAIKLGLNVPIRPSGDIKGSAPIAIVGPKGAIYLEEGCIVAQRHIHMSAIDAVKIGVKDNQIVSVKTGEGVRKGVLSNVQVRVDKSFTLEMHIDTDEANGLGIKCNDYVEIIK